MYTAYVAGTPNGRKVPILLEELGVPYEVRKVDIGQGEQNDASFRALNPNGKIPVLVDDEGPGDKPIAIFESGAILIYLAEKAKSPLLPAEGAERYAVLQWLMFQMAGVGPMFGQYGHFDRGAPERLPYAIDRYQKETKRLYGVLDVQLGQGEFLAGDYSIADIATYPWASAHGFFKIDVEPYPNVRRWLEVMGKRPAVQRGMKAI
ncbi:MAG: glutathione S-transferase N-terminal domain-containing protein [Polyangiaceae bacterium]|jgi:GSH-dependent disulfide-bond oxidoreductase|nr:glutathione S-transferase N-terminal domain-containing protein [Polyangiaceae bacterium]